MEHAYAQALWKAVEGGRGRAGMTPHSAVKAVRERLSRDGRTALLPRIARALKRLAERESKKNNLVLTVAREKDERRALRAAKKVLAKLGMKKVELTTRVDDTVIGGWRLEGRGVLVDNSYKARLLEIYHHAARA
jgi:F0F1-type ATP synthase delta subunit